MLCSRSDKLVGCIAPPTGLLSHVTFFFLEAHYSYITTIIISPARTLVGSLGVCYAYMLVLGLRRHITSNAVLSHSHTVVRGESSLRVVRDDCVTVWEDVETTGILLPGTFHVYPGCAR